MKATKRLLAVFLSVLMLAGVLMVAPTAVSAAETESGSVGVEYVTMRVGEYHSFRAEAPWNGAIVGGSCAWTVNSPYYLEQVSSSNTSPSITYKALKATSSDIYVNCDFYYRVEGSYYSNRGSVSYRVTITGGSSGGSGGSYEDDYSDEKVWVNFNANGGSVYPTQKKVWKSYSIGDLPTPTRSGYTFERWEYADGSIAHSYDYVYRNITLYAIWSKNSSSSSSTTTTPKPGTPAISSLSYNGSSNTLKWSAASNATGYQIARKKTGQSDYTYFTTSSTSYTETSVTPGVKYTYQVRAKNGSTYGAYSASKTVVTLTKPDNLTVSNKSNGIRAEWSAVSGAQKYKVYYKSEKDSGWKSATTSNTYYPLLNTVSGRKYAFQIQALGTDNVAGPYSAVKNIVYKNPQLSVKPTVTLSNKSNGIRAEWGKVSGATKYNVYYKKSADSSWSTAQTTNNYYALLKLNAGTQYSVQVQPVFGSEKGAYSAVKSLAYAPQVKPTVTLANKSNGIRAEWGKVSGATKYNVYYKKSADSSWSTAQTANNYYPLLNISAGAQYSVQVQPVFGSAKGMYSAVKSLTYIPQVKPEVTLVNNSNGVSASWKAVSGATGYVVYYKKSADSQWSSIETSGTSYQMLNLTNGTAYSVQVQPVFNGTKGLYSAVKSITYQGSATIPNVRPSLTVSKTTSRINLSWTSVSGADKYRVYYTDSTDTSNLKTADVSGTTAYFSNPTKGLTYYFMVAPVFGDTVGELSELQVITF